MMSAYNVTDDRDESSERTRQKENIRDEPIESGIGINQPFSSQSECKPPHSEGTSTPLREKCVKKARGTSGRNPDESGVFSRLGSLQSSYQSKYTALQTLHLKDDAILPFTHTQCSSGDPGYPTESGIHSLPESLQPSVHQSDTPESSGEPREQSESGAPTLPASVSLQPSVQSADQPLQSEIDSNTNSNVGYDKIAKLTSEKFGYDYKVNNRSGCIEISSDTRLSRTSLSGMLASWRTCSILVSGGPGSGKSTLRSQLCHHFQSRSMIFIHLMILEEFKQQFMKVEGNEVVEISREAVAASSSSHCLVIFECGTNFLDKASNDRMIKGIMERKMLPESTLLYTSTPSQVDQVKSTVKIDHHFTLEGFTKSGREKYLKSHSTHSDEILSYLRHNQLETLYTNPLVCTKIVEIFRGRTFQEPKTITDFLYKLVTAVVTHYFDTEEKASIGSRSQLALECLPEPVGAAFDGVCLLAFEHMLHGHKCANIGASQHFLSTFSLKLAGISLNELYRFGLVDASTQSESAYKFLDPVIIEFLAAFHLHKQAPLNQISVLYQNTSSLLSTPYKLWPQLFFGLVGGDYSKHVTLFNPTKLMLNSVIDVLVHSLELNYEAEHRYTLIKCIHESQEKSLFRKLAAKHPTVLSFSVSIREFDKRVQPVSTLMNKSGCAEWIVSTAAKNRWVVDKIKDNTHNISITMNYNVENNEIIAFSPKRSSSVVAKMYRDGDHSHQTLSEEEKVEKLNQFCCRAVREILQRVLTLYSPIKIKGDASNISYVSFLTCACFKDSFLAHVELFPLQPVHFLPGPKKDLASLPKGSLNPTDRHNLEQHKGESMEVVIMLRPIIQKLEGVVPVTNQRFSLLFSHGPLDFFPESSSSSDKSKLISMERCIDRYQINGPLTEQILPPLPVVQKTIYGRSQTAYPKPFLPPVQVPRVDPSLPTIGEEAQADLEIGSRGNSSSTNLNPVVMTQLQVASQVTFASSQGLMSEHSRIRLSQAHAIAPTSIQPSQAHNFVEQAVGEVQVHQPASSRRQTALRPGTVLFTSMADKISSDRIQPLPLQRSLIRRGGNGSIYSENIAGTTLAVKKTSYRSKEYAIITKIHHKNIIPLLAYVWGEEHAENRRRYYVYHYLPKLSGDLARLVTDKEELSLYEFHKDHQYTDFKAMGVAVGNIKYILSQVLEALQYLHNIHIAHRDLKASNVLIKFFCACANPLVCGCEVKFQVVLCDFDATIELDSNDQIPVTSSSQANTHVEIVPVGTNGFRSPESSMHTIANTPTVFSPPLTTKTDIYSLGILAMRLMISTDTPYSQRSMAMLLLYYHQLKGKCTGRIADKLSPYHKLDRYTKQKLSGRRWVNYLRIEENEVLEVLKLNKLKSKMRWLRGGYEFVRQCLNVDPETRPTAGNLLADSFLNWYENIQSVRVNWAQVAEGSTTEELIPFSQYTIHCGSLLVMGKSVSNQYGKCTHIGFMKPDNYARLLLGYLTTPLSNPVHYNYGF